MNWADVIGPAGLLPLLAATLRLALPIVLAAAGECLAQRSGVFNLGLEGIMLVGALAAFLTVYRTGQPLLGGVAGALAGMLVSVLVALSYKEDGKIKMKPSYIGGWNEAAAQTKEAVVALTEQDADVFVPCGVDAATIEAAKQTDTYAIGYVMDQSPLAKDNVLASVVWNLDKVLEKMVADVRADRVDPAKYYKVGYADGGVSVAINPKLKSAIPAETMKTFEDYEKRMADGEFEAPYVPE